jgi:hypothetical protein
MKTTVNMSLRKFLKKVGVASQREIEEAIRAAIKPTRCTLLEFALCCRRRVPGMYGFAAVGRRCHTDPERPPVWRFDALRGGHWRPTLCRS